MLDITAATPWVHSDDASNVSDGSGPITNILVGSAGVAGNTWRGRIAAVATWDTVLSDGQVEAACTLAASDLFDAGPDWMVRLNQASTATPVSDDTGNGGDQTAISGTAVDADDPPGFDYSLTPPPAEGSVALTLDLALAALGARASQGSAALGLGLALAGAGARDSQGSAGVGLGLALSASGARASQGSASLGLGLALAGAGARGSAGSAALGLNLALNSQGPGGACSLVPVFPGACETVETFPGVCVPVPTFLEAT